MKKVLSLLALFLAFAPNLFADALPKTEWEISPEIYHFKYEEPGIMENKGVMYGLRGSLVSHRWWMFKIEGSYATGKVDYTSNGSGSVDNLDDYTYEGRFLGGPDFKFKDGKIALTPFFGAAYRYLNDDSAGRVTSTGHRGYERESKYWYGPLGAELMIEARGGWSFGASGEYDIFWSGEQTSHLSGAVASLNDVKNSQDSGYGARFSLKAVKKGENFDILIEPFFRWWKIDESDLANVTYAGVLVGYGYEPNNKTTEIGAKVGILF